MIIDLIKLQNGIEKEIKIDEPFELSEEYIKKTDLLEIKNTYIKGYIKKDIYEGYYLDVILSGTMIGACAITLKPVEHQFNIEINGNLEELFEEIDKNVKKGENTIDILPIIWENILMEIPMRFVSEEANNIELKGDGWKFISDDKPSLNPELQKLQDLLK